MLGLTRLAVLFSLAQTLYVCRTARFSRSCKLFPVFFILFFLGGSTELRRHGDGLLEHAQPPCFVLLVFQLLFEFLHLPGVLQPHVPFAERAREICSCSSSSSRALSYSSLNSFSASVRVSTSRRNHLFAERRPRVACPSRSRLTTRQAKQGSVRLGNRNGRKSRGAMTP